MLRTKWGEVLLVRRDTSHNALTGRITKLPVSVLSDRGSGWAHLNRHQD
jgi:hypothetical protein